MTTNKKIQPDSEEINSLISRFDGGKFKEAIIIAQSMTVRFPHYAFGWKMLGAAFNQLGQSEEALSPMQKAAGLSPGDAGAHYNLGVIFQSLGQSVQAEASYRRALEINPDYAEAHNNLGNTLYSLGRLVEAEASYRRASQLKSDFAEAHSNLGNVLRELVRLEEAEVSCRRALLIKPEFAGAHNNLGKALQDLGRLKEAQESYRRAFTIRPNFTKAQFNYVQTKKISHDDEIFIGQLEDLIGKGALNSDEKSDIYFSLGKCYDDLGKYDQAFLNYEKGHQLEGLTHPFDPKQNVNGVNKLISLFGKEFFSKRHEFGSNSEEPIFIVGMPRSGTTLAEQIISSHPSVCGAGELTFLSDRRKTLSLDDIRQFNRQQALSLADDYLVHLHSYSASALHITDKMPQNFFHLGLIRLCFPRARIIHCKRNPLDTCLSIYFQKFTLDHPYTHDLGNLGGYYAQYLRLMQHWREVLPGSMFEVEYEELVADQVGMTKRLLEFCNLEWDDSCLNFNSSERVVNTASSWQVRQPMYSSSVARWKRYESFLEPLMQFVDVPSKLNHQGVDVSAVSRKLHIGGKLKRDGWEVINALPGSHVDHLGNANDLTKFADDTFDTLYASHVVEHFDYDKEILSTLVEWRRVLKPGGVIMISVPDLEVLSAMILNKKLTQKERFMAMRMIFGGHMDKYDYHYVGLTEEFLKDYLLRAGFVKIERLKSFGIFNDCSELKHVGQAISLNLKACNPV
jgi:tetratricopeptide (TPR) repeat protein/predicted SAM-dependent methyltransferase